MSEITSKPSAYFKFITKTLSLFGLWKLKRHPVLVSISEGVFTLHIILSLALMLLEVCFIRKALRADKSECLKGFGVLALRSIFLTRLVAVRIIWPGLRKIVRMIDRKSMEFEGENPLLVEKLAAMKERSDSLSFVLFNAFYFSSLASVFSSYLYSVFAEPQYMITYEEASNTTTKIRLMPYNHCRIMGSSNTAFYLEMFFQWYLNTSVSGVFLGKYTI